MITISHKIELVPNNKHYVNSQMKEYMGSFYSYFEILQNLKEINPVQARMPFELNIK